MKRLAILALLAVPAVAQEIHFDTPSAQRPGVRQHVELIDDHFLVTANRGDDLELRFRVGPGLHINSHKPKDELMLPTVLKLDLAAGVHVQSIDYPAGKPFKLNIGAGALLDVYEGEFRVHLRVQAAKGTTIVHGTLRYQACDTASCFPPRTLPVTFTVQAQ
ncbi:MAG: protein-disulfide reductase DsbD N-terminal domain-containing protein [Acidobacteriaceae bacterium]|nr:protein-disulfide reductase DsbD N-terminal domain-containing protein [Acidobacteriaceae bacterium]